jgi:hypothetical protein
MAKTRNAEFDERFNKAKEALGWHYAAITTLFHPEITKDQLHSVANRNAENWEVLQAMEDVVVLLEQRKEEALKKFAKELQ